MYSVFEQALLTKQGQSHYTRHKGVSKGGGLPPSLWKKIEIR